MKVKATITFTFDLIIGDDGFESLDKAREWYSNNPGDLFECAGWDGSDPNWPKVSLEPLPEGYQPFAKDDDGHDHATDV
jgi:hypothetical protein